MIGPDTDCPAPRPDGSPVYSKWVTGEPNEGYLIHISV